LATIPIMKIRHQKRDFEVSGFPSEKGPLEAVQKHFCVWLESDFVVDLDAWKTAPQRAKISKKWVIFGPKSLFSFSVDKRHFYFYMKYSV
jgi:hypothetical protein